MMRKSVSHRNPTTSGSTHSLQWFAMVAIGTLTILMGILVLMALMSPENLKAAPTITLVCVLVLLCVPVPVLMLERNHRKAVQRTVVPSNQQPPTTQIVHTNRQGVIHESHSSHNSHHESRRATHPNPDRKPDRKPTNQL